mmetsp:Transcript_123989/g.194384  ORF Transcript_123989/g.194384 Transcript_123989/m.194384 type:complete len:392 (+) Transcript_123989:1-1176(+)
MSSLKCYVRTLEDVISKLQRYGSDHYVTSLKDVGAHEAADKLSSLRVDGELAQDVFSHCYALDSEDVMADGEKILKACGLGLRKKRFKGSSHAGCILALFNKLGPTKLSQIRSSLSDTDTRLPTHDRLDRSTLLFQEVESSTLDQFARRHARNHFLTALASDDGPMACKKYIITMKYGEELVSKKFTNCVMSKVDDCMSVVRCIEQYGLGCRSKKVRCRAVPGWIALLFNSSNDPSVASRVSDVIDNASNSLVAKGAGTHSKRSRENGSLTGDVLQEPAASKMRFDRHLNSGHQKCPIEIVGADNATPNESHQRHPSIVEEETHYRVSKVLEKKSRRILAKLPRASICTDSVQNKLEERMHKPPGHFDRYRLEISRIWRTYLDDTADQDIP